MPFNGVGTYTAPAGNPVVPGTVVSSSWANSLVQDLSNTLNNVVARDGQTQFTGQLKIADGSQSTPSLIFNSENTSGLFRPVAGAVSVGVLGNEAIRATNANVTLKGNNTTALVATNGRVLIAGATDDTVTALQVNGNATVSNSFTAGGINNTPIGATTPSTAVFTDTTTASLTLDGGLISGNFAGTPYLGTRTLVQSNQNTYTEFGVIPPAGQTASYISAYNSGSAPENASLCEIYSSSTQVGLQCSSWGTGTYKPLYIKNGGQTALIVGTNQVISSATFASINSGPLAGFRNAIINGNFSVANRNSGSSAAMGASATSHIVDRWRYAASPTNCTVQTVAGDATSIRAVRITKNTGSDAGNAVVVQSVESLGSYRFAGKTVTLSYRARVGATYTGNSAPQAWVCTGTGTDQTGAGPWSGAWTGNNLPTLTVLSNSALTTTFQTYAYSCTVPANATQIGICIGMLCTAVAGSSTDYIEITDVQLEQGKTYTPFEVRDMAIEESLCQRYAPWFRSAGTNYVGQAISTTEALITIPFAIKGLFAATGISTTAVSNYSLTNSAGVTTVLSSLTTSSSSKHGITLKATVGSAILTAGHATVLTFGAGGWIYCLGMEI